MEKQIAEQIADLKAGLEGLAKQAEQIGKSPHHGTPGTMGAARGRINGAIEMIEAHQAWLKENPEPSSVKSTAEARPATKA